MELLLFFATVSLSTEKIKENDLAVFRTEALTTHRRHSALPLCMPEDAKPCAVWHVRLVVRVWAPIAIGA